MNEHGCSNKTFTRIGGMGHSFPALALDLPVRLLIKITFLLIGFLRF